MQLYTCFVKLNTSDSWVTVIIKLSDEIQKEKFIELTDCHGIIDVLLEGTDITLEIVHDRVYGV